MLIRIIITSSAKMPNANRGSYCRMIYQGLGNEALDFGLAAPAHEAPPPSNVSMLKRLFGFILGLASIGSAVILLAGRIAYHAAMLSLPGW